MNAPSTPPTTGTLPEADDPLQALLVESTTQAAELFSLDDLLSESMAIRQEKDQEKELRKRQQRNDISKEEYDLNAALLRRWELAREWDAVANVLLFSRQRCGYCGSFHNSFEGRYELHTHKRLVKTQRTVAVTVHTKDLPKTVQYTDSDVEICHTCADTQSDWELEDDTADEIVRVYATPEELEQETLQRMLSLPEYQHLAVVEEVSEELFTDEVQDETL